MAGLLSSGRLRSRLFGMFWLSEQRLSRRASLPNCRQISLRTSTTTSTARPLDADNSLLTRPHPQSPSGSAAPMASLYQDQGPPAAWCACRLSPGRAASA